MLVFTAMRYFQGVVNGFIYIFFHLLTLKSQYPHINSPG